MTARSSRLLVLLSAFALSACFPDRLSGKACDDAHACLDGWRCVDSVCLPADDGGSTVDGGDGLDGGGLGDGGSGAGASAADDDGGVLTFDAGIFPDG